MNCTLSALDMPRSLRLWCEVFQYDILRPFSCLCSKMRLAVTIFEDRCPTASTREGSIRLKMLLGDFDVLFNRSRVPKVGRAL